MKHFIKKAELCAFTISAVLLIDNMANAMKQDYGDKKADKDGYGIQRLELPTLKEFAAKEAEHHVAKRLLQREFFGAIRQNNEIAVATILAHVGTMPLDVLHQGFTQALCFGNTTVRNLFISAPIIKHLISTRSLMSFLKQVIHMLCPLEAIQELLGYLIVAGHLSTEQLFELQEYANKNERSDFVEYIDSLVFHRVLYAPIPEKN